MRWRRKEKTLEELAGEFGITVLTGAVPNKYTPLKDRVKGAGQSKTEAIKHMFEYAKDASVDAIGGVQYSSKNGRLQTVNAVAYILSSSDTA